MPSLSRWRLPCIDGDADGADGDVLEGNALTDNVDGDFFNDFEDDFDESDMNKNNKAAPTTSNPSTTAPAKK